MLRFLIWRLGFEWAHLKRILVPGEKKVLYFGFGANLDPRVLRRRRLKVFSEKVIPLEGYRLSFSNPGPWKHAGFASVEIDPHSQVWGKLYEILESDLKRLCYAEMLPIFGRHRLLKSKWGNHEFYFFQATEYQENLLPTAVYRGFLLRGLEQEKEVAPSYLQWLRSVRTVRANRYRDDSRMFVNIAAFPSWIQPALRAYQKACYWIFVRVVGYSLLNRFVAF